MNTLRPLALAAGLFGAAVALPRAAAAQSFVPQPQLYLLTTDVVDGRALWVQPAGLARRREASVSAMATVDHDTGGTALSQYGVTLANRGVGFGWQHDRIVGGAHSDTYVLGYAAGTPRFSVGVDRRWHRGTNTRTRTRTRTAAWDVGARYSAGAMLELSLAWRDIGSPVVVGDTIKATLVPGAALRLLGGRFRLGADWEIVRNGWGTSAVRTGVAVMLPANLALALRSEFTSRFSTRNVAVALAWGGGRRRLTGFGASAHGAADRFGVWGSMVSEVTAPRRRSGR